MPKWLGMVTLLLIALSLMNWTPRAPRQISSPKRATFAPARFVAAKTAVKTTVVRDDGRFALKAPVASIADTPWGILYVQPPRVHGRQDFWKLDLSPVPGPHEIQNSPEPLAKWRDTAVGSLTIAGITGPYALVVSMPPPGTGGDARLWAVNLYGGQKRTIYQWNPATGTAPFAYGQGKVGWWINGTGEAEILDLATSRRITVPGVMSAKSLAFNGRTFTVNGQPLGTGDFRAAPAAVLPASFRWVSFPGQDHPSLAIPVDWQITTASSHFLSAMNPRHPEDTVKVALVNNPAAFLPAPTVPGPPSPAAAVPSGAQAQWMTDHIMRYRLKAAHQSTLGLISIGPAGNGLIASATFEDEATRPVARTILDTVRLP